MALKKIEKYCTNCNKQLITGAMFCSMCGTKVEEEKKCKECGTKLAQEAMFCHVCGVKYGEQQQVMVNNDWKFDFSDGKSDNKVNSYMSIEEKRNQIINILNNKGWRIVKQCGENIFVISQQDKSLSKYLYLIDLREVSYLDLKKEDLLLGVQNIKRVFLGIEEGCGWIGMAHNNRIYYMIGFALHQIELGTMEDVCIFDKENKEGVLEVIKCLNGSIRILYYSKNYSCSKDGFVLNEKGQVIWQVFESEGMNVFHMNSYHCQFVEVEDMNGYKQNREDNIGLLDVYTGKVVIPCKYRFFGFCQEKTTGKIIIAPCRIKRSLEGPDENIVDNYYCIDNDVIRKLDANEVNYAIEMGIRKIDFLLNKSTKNYKLISDFKDMKRLYHVNEFSNI